MSGNTPAPWRASNNRVIDANDCEVCEVHQTVSRPSAQECADVAEMIAALPELLETLRSLDLTCTNDRLNPCWDGRPTDVPGKHWGGGVACAACTTRAVMTKAAMS